MKFKQLIFLLWIVCVSAHAQIDDSKDKFYIEAHSLIDEMLRKDKGGIIMTKAFDFDNEQNLGKSPLYDKMLGSYLRWSVTSKEVRITPEDYNDLKDKTGWLRDSSSGLDNHWDKNLLLKSTPILVDSLIVQGRRESKDPIPFRPIQINFKGNLALIEYEMSNQLELRAYVYRNGNWQLIGAGSNHVYRDE